MQVPRVLRQQTLLSPFPKRAGPGSCSGKVNNSTRHRVGPFGFEPELPPVPTMLPCPGDTATTPARKPATLSQSQQFCGKVYAVKVGFRRFTGSNNFRAMPVVVVFNHNCVLREQKKRHRPPLPTVASAGWDPDIRQFCGRTRVRVQGIVVRASTRFHPPPRTGPHRPLPRWITSRRHVVDCLGESLETHSLRSVPRAHHRRLPGVPIIFQTDPLTPANCRTH